MPVNDLLPALIDRIVTHFAPERIVVFGSQAREDAKPDSDLDLLLVMTDEATDCRRTAVDVRVKLADMPMPIDILVTTPTQLAQQARIDGSVFSSALAEGRVLYARS